MCRELTAELYQYLSNVKAKTDNDRINICMYLYNELIHNPASAPELLKFFYENADRVESSEEITADSVITEADAKKLLSQYAEVVDAIFEQILAKNLPVEQFYTKLWDAISESPTFEDDQAKAFALYYIWIDVRIPYFQLENGLTMSNSEFRNLSESQYESIQKARFILRTKLFKQRTARASVLLNLLESIENEKERVVLMAHILSFSVLSPSHSAALRELVRKMKDSSGQT